MVIIRYFVQLKMFKVYIKFCVILFADIDIIIPTVVQFLKYVRSFNLSTIFIIIKHLLIVNLVTYNC